MSSTFGERLFLNSKTYQPASSDYNTFTDRAADLGFTLRGGTGSPVIHGDLGIFIDKVIPGSLVDKKLSPGDRILSVSSLL